jgi:hypothetical protein
MMIKHIRGLQTAMFRGFNSLRLFDVADKQVVARVVLPSSRHHVFRIRRDIDRILHEISEELGGASQSSQPMQPGYEEFLSTEREAARLRRQYIHEDGNEGEEESQGRQSGLPDDIEKNIQSMPEDFIRQLDSKSTDDPSPGLPEAAIYLAEQDGAQNPIQKLKTDYVAMQKLQADLLHSILTTTCSSPQRVLRMEEKLPSLLEHYGPDHRRGDIKNDPSRSVSRSRNVVSSSEAAKFVAVDKEDEPRGRTTARQTVLEKYQTHIVANSDLVQLSRALSTVCSLLFSTE